MEDPSERPLSMLRPSKGTVVIIVAILLITSSVVAYFYAIYLPSTATTPCITTGRTHCFTIVANSNGYNASRNQPLPYPIMNVQRGDTVVLRLINNDSTQSYGLAVQSYTPNGIVTHPGDTKSTSFQATTTGKFRIYDPIITTIEVYEKAELDVS
ncbi:MAG TPA: hypothetical protein VGS11_00270 [Candidatus Bathyarchaeia archaeon]|nr:hypothetical protein [Candidatus Bathyarchaeia archaeon]